MDVVTVVGVLAPVLPYLVAKAGDVATGKAIKKVGKPPVPPAGAIVKGS